MSGNTSRKPSGSSTHSGAHSPLGSPNNGQSQRTLNPTAAVNMYGVGMHSNGRKGLNSGWQVWGSATPSSKKKASASSVTSTNDLSLSHSDTSYRGNLSEGWTSSRPTSGTWDEASDLSQGKDISHLEPQLNLHLRQRQTNVTQPSVSGPRTVSEDRSAVVKNRQFSPQYDSSNKESNAPRFPPSSPSRHFGVPGYANLQNGAQSAASAVSYETLQTSSVNDDLSVALRGMVVEDEYHLQQRQHPGHPSSSLQTRVPAPISQHRPYATYPQADYNSYYNIAPPREPYIEYPYGYDTYRTPSEPPMYAPPGTANISPGNPYSGMTPQGLHPSMVPDMHRPIPGVFFEYGPTSPVYYSQPQAVMYPAPSHSPMLNSQIPATLADKKRELQYNIQQQLSSQPSLYGQMRSTPSPHPQRYPSLEYSPQMPLVMSGALYGSNPVYSHGIRPIRRGDVTLPALPPRSPLLDDFRVNKVRKWELRDIFGFIVEFSGDQHGSRFIQQKLESATSEDKDRVFDEIVPNYALQLIRDVFGNYVIQKLFEHGNLMQKNKLVNIMEGHILQLSLQMYGCRVVQKAIEYVLPEHQVSFIRELEPHVLKCVKDSNGNHVVQKLVECVPADRLGFVSAFCGNVYDLASHPYGCRVLQRCLENLPEERTCLLMEELHKYTIHLMQDQFGNYVIQYILEHGKPHDKTLVVSKLRGQFLQMARHKFASNVCEKALVCADSESRRALIDEIMAPRPDGVTPIITMMKDQYANYVLQRALAVVEGDQRDVLISKIRPQLVNMRRYANAYTKHLNSIERLLEKYPKEPLPQLAVTPP